jgi:poly-gamma-glutamate synthesis protein (capsule biosynthesis protein)
MLGEGMTSIAIAVTGQALLHNALDLAAPGAERVRDMLGRADAALANLEATVETEGAWPTKTRTLHLTTSDGIASLRALGLDVLTHANNHAFDLGPPGIARTRAAAEAAGFRLVGSGMDRNQAARPALIRTPAGTVAVLSGDMGPQPEIVYASDERAGINPLRVRRKVVVPLEEHAILRAIVEGLGDHRREAARAAVGYRASSPKGFEVLEIFGTEVEVGSSLESRYEADSDDLVAFRSALGDARDHADLVVVALHNHHWDPDWGRTPRWVTDLACRLIDDGADLVIGTGSPVLQGLSFHRGKPILAGLGNLIFHTRRGKTYDREGVDVWAGAICRCEFDLGDRTCRRIEVLPVSVGRPAEEEGTLPQPPSPLEETAARRVFETLTAGLRDEDRVRVVRV